MPDNRRSQTRYQVTLDATLTVGEQVLNRTIANLSLGGCHLIHDERLAIGTRVQLEFRIPTSEKAIAVGGSTRWSNDEGSGIQFDGLRAAEVWSLNKYFESLQG